MASPKKTKAPKPEPVDVDESPGAGASPAEAPVRKPRAKKAPATKPAAAGDEAVPARRRRPTGDGKSMLAIAEKDIAAKRIAEILSNGKARRAHVEKTSVYSWDDKETGREWHVVGLKGHIVELDFPREFRSWTRGDLKQLIQAEPERKVENRAIGNALKRLAPECSDVIIGTDYDREGELIGYEALELVKGARPDIRVTRARYSAITPKEVKAAFGKPGDLDMNLVNAAESRQLIDLVWGATLTRFLSVSSGQLGGNFLSVGRVQSPTLAIIVDREKSIKAFVPTPYWEVEADCDKGLVFLATHRNGKFEKKHEAERAFARARAAKEATVLDVTTTQRRETPPTPFSTTLYIKEATRIGFSAARAMSVAEDLYMNGFLSYPRTDNTVYPASQDLNEILDKLAQGDMKKEVEFLRSHRRASPTRGKKETTDHPPIMPAEKALRSQLNPEQWKVYELVSRRFLATLAEDAKSESVRADLDLNGEPFKANGYRVIEPNWKFLYPYAVGEDRELPALQKGDEVVVREVRILAKETKPPSRYSQGSLIQEMERLSLGTKSTRHEIIQKLYSRNYVVGNPPVPTNVGYAVTDALENHADVIAKPDMTATLEKDMDHIAEGTKTLQEVVQESRDLLAQAYTVLEKNREPIGEKIRVAMREESKLGKCPTCKQGDLMVRVAQRSRKRFVGCSAYPACNQTYPLPQRGGLRPLNETCTFCGAPRVRILSAGRRPWDLCVNFTCPSKTQKAPGTPVAVKAGGEQEAEAPPPADVDEGSEEEAQ